jgi:hypothetical protein
MTYNICDILVPFKLVSCKLAQLISCCLIGDRYENLVYERFGRQMRDDLLLCERSLATELKRVASE